MTTDTYAPSSPSELPDGRVGRTSTYGGGHYDTGLVHALRNSTAAAASAATAWWGLGDKNAADEASVAAMRAVLVDAPFDGTVVIGEGEKDDAPMLANRERLGSAAAGSPEVDIAVDPLDGTRLVADGVPGSVCVIAIAPRGTLFDPVDTFYMDKLVSSAAGVGVLSLDATATENVLALALALGKRVKDLRVSVLDKPRHTELIAELKATGALVIARKEGDISPAISAADPDGEIDLAVGIGGTPEGIVTACAVRALGGFMEARLAPQTDAERTNALAAGHDLDRTLTLDDLVASDRVLMVSTTVDSPS